MSKLVRYLQQHIIGEALDGEAIKQQFATDASAFKIKPLAVVFPNGEQDVRRTVRFLWQLAEKGASVGITARGGGTDLTGASVGPGLTMVFTTYMNQILSYDDRKDSMVVEAGANLDKIQQTLNVNYRFLPALPASSRLATVGGSIANNSGGCYSEKYGLIGNYVSSLRVVLANGEIITAGKLSKRALNRKLGLANFEGQIYRQLDKLLSESAPMLSQPLSPATVNTGYNLEAVRGKDGSFSLLPLLIGCQGTLGLVTSAELRSESHNPQPQTFLIEFNDITDCLAATQAIKKLQPAALEFVDSGVLKQIAKISPLALKNIIKNSDSTILLVEFDDASKATLARKLKRMANICRQFKGDPQLSEQETDRQKLWKVRRAVSYLLTDTTTKGRAVPVIENAAVPLDNFANFYQDAQALFKKLHLPFMAWGHIGMGQISLVPKIDLSEVSGRQRVIKLLDSYSALVKQYGGSMNGCHNDGRLRSHCLAENLGAARAEIDMQVKQIMDPYNIFNPEVKVIADKNQLLNNLNDNYDLISRYQDLAWF